MTRKRKTGLSIGAVAACITVMCAAGACKEIMKEEKAMLPAATTSTTATTTTPASTEPYHGQTSGDFIYVNGFGWVFNEVGGGYGETNHEMYCNGNKIGYFG